MCEHFSHLCAIDPTNFALRPNTLASNSRSHRIELDGVVTAHNTNTHALSNGRMIALKWIDWIDENAHFMQMRSAFLSNWNATWRVLAGILSTLWVRRAFVQACTGMRWVQTCVWWRFVRTTTSPHSGRARMEAEWASGVSWWMGNADVWIGLGGAGSVTHSQDMCTYIICIQYMHMRAVEWESAYTYYIHARAHLCVHTRTRMQVICAWRHISVATNACKSWLHVKGWFYMWIR